MIPLHLLYSDSNRLDSITLMTLCRPMLADMRPIWKQLLKHVLQMQSVLNNSGNHVDLQKPFLERYNKNYHKVNLSACLTSSCSVTLCQALQILQAFEAAFLLDPGNAVNHGGRLCPPWQGLKEEDKANAKTILKRLAPYGRAMAMIDELMDFINAGYVDQDFAARAQVTPANLDLPVLSAISTQLSLTTEHYCRERRVRMVWSGCRQCTHASSCGAAAWASSTLCSPTWPCGC